MERKLVLTSVVVILFTSLLGVALRVEKVQAVETIYIRADGSIDPPDAPIQRNGDTYTLKDNINGDHFHGIEIERNNMTLNGAGYTLRGIGSGYGILLRYRNNITIENFRIEEYNDGLALFSCANIKMLGNSIINSGTEGINVYGSLNNLISRNTITNSSYAISFLDSNNSVIHSNNLSSNLRGIDLWLSPLNTISNNTIRTQRFINSMGIRLRAAPNTTITENTIENHQYGLDIWSSSEHTLIIGNTITNSTIGIDLESSNNTIYHNNLVNNTIQARSQSSISSWDNDCEGNYWSDYEEMYPAATYDTYGIGDISYVIDEINMDRFPLVNPFWTLADRDHDLEVDIFDVVIVTAHYGSASSDPSWNCHSDVAQPYGVINIFDVVTITARYGESR